MKTTLCECGKRVANAQALKQHRLDSPNHDAVSCDCGARFVTAEARDQHQRDSPLHAQKDHSQKVTQNQNNKKKQPTTALQNISTAPAEPAAVPAPETMPPTETTAKASDFQCCGKKFKTKKHMLQHQEDSLRHGQSSTKKPVAAPKNKSTRRAWAPATSSYGVAFFRQSDMEYGLCDKDCGWCGNCMRGVNI
ncbi:hypothetical protein QBC40DRAFT_282934 [Triangularia verruculosa]|uniref:C2H2-type domain-containing protein n=1 Tax=Triangularia verruculosa TaxID=2587418 RepID=A0AAN6XDQ4_9PEZI|nr:hypothetical protein QBC40DRAFT_282934 [Triangularia verruculosa]